MPTPKTVTKLTKVDGKVVVEYTERFDQASYMIHELTRAALRDVGKFVKKVFNTSFYQHFGKRTGNAARITRVKVQSSAKTLYPRVEIGLPYATQKTRTYAYYAYMQEFGSSTMPRLGLLTRAAQNNIPEIVRIESQYLSYLEGEADRLEALVDEHDYDLEGEEE